MNGTSGTGKTTRTIRPCSCTHPRAAHTEFGSTARTNGPTTNRACELCDCWTYRPDGEPQGPPLGTSGNR